MELVSVEPLNAMKTIFLLMTLLSFSILESRAESREEVPTPTWSALATKAKPEGRDFEKQFRLRHFYLVSQGLCTRVPRESILHLPERFQDSIRENPEGKQVSWIAFLTANQSWLRRQDVTWQQVLGNVAFAPSTLKGLASDDRLVIATYEGGPVTVLSQGLDKSGGKEPNQKKK